MGLSDSGVVLRLFFSIGSSMRELFELIGEKPESKKGDSPH